MYKCAPLSMLRVGAKLSSPIHDSQHKLLLGTGIEITQDFLVKLHKRGVRSVSVEEKDWIRLTAFESKGKVNKAPPNHRDIKSDLQSGATNELDEAIGQSSDCEVVVSDNPFAAQIQSHGATRYEQEKMDRLIDNHQQTASQISDLIGRLEDGQTVSEESLNSISRESVMQAAEDMDLFVCMGINPIADDSIFMHSTNVATLAIALGANLGLDEESLCDLGAGCLVHDAGMLHIDQNMCQSKHVLDSLEFLTIAKHPIISADLLYENMKRVPLGVRMVVYQMHERCDGSGYPRGWTGDRIHPLAKISAVADAYVALISPRSHRHAMLPYFAMKKILEDVNAGLYDSTVVRALLQTISLFPIGSYCELEGSQLAKVIRANGPVYDRPVVEAWHRDRLTETPEVIDLMEKGLKVVKPLTALR